MKVIKKRNLKNNLIFRNVVLVNDKDKKGIYCRIRSRPFHEGMWGNVYMAILDDDNEIVEGEICMNALQRKNVGVSEGDEVEVEWLPEGCPCVCEKLEISCRPFVEPNNNTKIIIDGEKLVNGIKKTFQNNFFSEGDDIPHNYNNTLGLLLHINSCVPLCGVIDNNTSIILRGTNYLIIN